MADAAGDSMTTASVLRRGPTRILAAVEETAAAPIGRISSLFERRPYTEGSFVCDRIQLSYEVHGEGDRTAVLMHGLLLDAQLNRRLAADLAEAGFRVVLLDLPGHGKSDKPRHASAHRMDSYAHYVVALMDELGLDETVVGGVSLGANVALQVAIQAPERVRGLLIEMPVLEWAVPAAAITFIPMLLAVHFARPLVRRTASIFQRLPRTGNGPVDSVMNTLSSDPTETAAVLHGILAGPIAPTVDQRAAMDVPALVIGHQVDRIHPFHDAEQLARRLPQGRLVQANSVLELRVNPERLTDEIAGFLDDAWGRPTNSRRQVS